MTKDFEELANRLAKARNFEGGAYCLITSIPNENTIQASYGGNANSILNGVEHMMKVLLESVDTDIQAAQIREVYKNVIIEDERRRFQEGGASVDDTETAVGNPRQADNIPAGE